MNIPPLNLAIEYVDHPIEGGHILHIPKDYQKKKLPHLNAWIEELRKPGLVQGRGMLCFVNRGNPDKIVSECCLGVYCRVAGLDHKVSTDGLLFYRTYLHDGDADTAGMFKEYHPNFYGTVEILRDNVELSIQPESDRDGTIPPRIRLELGNAKHLSLTDLNDTYLFSFTQIAQIVELLFSDEND